MLLDFKCKNTKFGLKIFYQNVRGLKTKTENIMINALRHDYSIIILTETWLNDTVFDHEILDNRYTIFRRDRASTGSSKVEGGGVLIAIMKNFLPLRNLQWETECEDLWVTLKLNQGTATFNLHICGIYIPPPVSLSNMERFLSNTTQIIQHKTTKKSIFLVAGDFNLSNLEWEYDEDKCILSPPCTKSQIDSLLVDTIAFNNLFQLNNITNIKKRTLDLVLTNSGHLFTVSENFDPLVTLDEYHPALNISFSCNSLKTPKINQISALNFTKSNYELIQHELSIIDWTMELQSLCSVDVMVDKFYGIIMPIINKNTPYTKKKNPMYPIWYSSSLIKTLHEKAKYHSKFKKYKNLRDKITFNMLRNRCDEMILHCYSKFKANAKEHIKKNPKYFWKFVKLAKSNSCNIPDDMYLQSKKAHGGKEISELFAHYFCSIFNKDGPTSNVISNGVASHTFVGSTTLSENDIFKSLKLLNIDKGPGPDLIPPLFLRTCATQLVKPLHIIFNNSLNEGTFPAKWKLAHVTPILKKGDQCDVANYRPISILSAFGKLFESLVQKTLLVHLKSQLSPHQHGFLPSRSTTSNLTEYVCYISQALEDKLEVHSVYTDFSKAFDVVEHNMLVQKLGHAGICGSLLRWCESYLLNRSQIVKIRGFVSEPRGVSSGVPQGSHLGPLFFVLFINDLCSSIQSNFKLFADDLKLYNTIKSSNDTEILQRDINIIDKWCTNNKMTLNASKCFCISFSRKQNPTNACYFINKTKLSEVTCIRDLGVMIDNQLNFRKHIDHIIKKGAQISGFVIRQTKLFKDPAISLLLFNCYVRSILEYCSAVWNPTYKIHINRLEKLQKRFLYHLCFANNRCHELTSYDARASFYRVTPLEKRRAVADLIFLYKIVNGHIDCSDLLNRLQFSVPRLSSRLHNRRTFVLPACRTNHGQNSPIYRLCSAYNNIDNKIDIFNASINSFKKSCLEQDFNFS